MRRNTLRRNTITCHRGLQQKGSPANKSAWNPWWEDTRKRSQRQSMESWNWASSYLFSLMSSSKGLITSASNLSTRLINVISINESFSSYRKSISSVVIWSKKWRKIPTRWRRLWLSAFISVSNSFLTGMHSVPYPRSLSSSGETLLNSSVPPILRRSIFATNTLNFLKRNNFLKLSSKSLRNSSNCCTTLCRTCSNQRTSRMRSRRKFYWSANRWQMSSRRERSIKAN